MFALSQPSPNRRPLLLLVLGLLVLEAYFFTKGRNLLGPYASPVVLLLSGIGAAVATGWYVRGRAWPAERTTPGPVGAGWYPVLAVLLGGGILACARELRHILTDYPVKLANSDIIPVLSVYVYRFVSGEPVYVDIGPEVGYQLPPGYLPAMWSPFIPAELLEFDYRWVAFAALVMLGFGSYWVALWRRVALPPLAVLALSAWPLLVLYRLMRSDPSVFGYAVESLPGAYYLALLVGVLWPSRVLRIAGLVLCLLSRYSLVFWVPLYFGLLYFRAGRREAVVTAGAVGVLVLGLYVVPFLSHDWSILARVQGAYSATALGEWQHLNEAGLPYHLYNGIGLTNLFYRFAPGELAQRLHLLQLAHAGLLLAVVAGAAWFYYRRAASARLDYRLYAVLTLKIYLVVFYTFIQVPYAYLATVSLWASLAVLLVLAGGIGAPAATAPAART